MFLTASLVLIEKPLQLVAFLPRIGRPICTRPDIRYISLVGLVVFAGYRKTRR
jgi:hypothetical protein